MIEIEKITAKEWIELYSELAHSAVFKERKPKHFDRIDFALLAKKAATIMGYVTCREHDHETLYWQFGGAFADAKASINVLPCYLQMIEACRKDYKRVYTLIENTNFAMLRLAMRAGFRIMGVRAYQNSILLEHLLEFEK